MATNAIRKEQHVFRRVGALAITAALAVGVVWLNGSRPSAAAPSTNLSAGITFDHATINDPVRMVGEPGINIDYNGGVYVHGPGGSTTQASWFWKSDDGGIQWHSVGVIPEGKSNGQNGGGDTEMTIARNNDAFGSDLQTTVCLSTMRSYDQGKTFNTSEGCYPSSDRQWMGVFDPNKSATGRRIYLLANPGLLDVSDGCYVLVSTDNGVTFLPPAGPTSTGAIVSGADCIGRQAVDPQTGEIFVPTTTGIYYSADGAVTWSKRGSNGAQGNFFAPLAMDTAGNLWQAWTTSCGSPAANPCKAFVSYSTDRGWTWTTRQVNTGAGSPLGQTPDLHQVLFPWLTVGDPGRVAVVFYGTTDTGRVSGFPGGPNALWHVYAVVSTDAMSASPTFTQVQADEHPNHRGTVCTGGFPGCLEANADRSMADFFVVDKDPDGRIFIAYNENSDLSNVVPGTSEYIGKPINAVIRLRTGPSLYAAKGTLRPVGSKSQLTGVGVRTGSNLSVAGQHGLPPGNWTTDPSGDAAFPVVPVRGADQPAMDILEASVGDDGTNLTATIRVKDLSTAAQAQAATALGVPSWMVTWWQGKGGIGPSNMAAPFDSHWFIKYLGGTQFAYGRVSSVDLPALGAPTPKLLTYAPSGTATGAVNGNTITMSVPLASLGGLAAGNKLDHVTAYALAEHTYETLASVVDEAKSFSYRIGTPASAQHAPDGYVEVSLDSSFTNPVRATLSGSDQWSANLTAACGTVYVRQVLSSDLYTPLWDDVQLGQTAQLDFPCATPSPTPTQAPTAAPTPFIGNLATGGGWLAAPGGGKVNFGFRAEQTQTGYSGDFQLNDKTSGVKVDGTQITAMNAISGSCGGIADSATSIEIRGDGKYNGTAASFRLCVSDLGQPGNSPGSTSDRLYLECTAGCSYRTSDHVVADTLGAGNISVSRPSTARTSDQSMAAVGMYALADPKLQPQTLILRPVLLTSAPVGSALSLTVNVYDGYQHPVNNASISLAIASGGTVNTVTAVTNGTGVATLPLTALSLQTEYIASVGAATSNSVAVSPSP